MRLKSRLAMSSVVATLIILVVSVLLATVVSYYAINVTSCRSQEESLNISNQHVWFDYTSQTAQAALLVTNTGGRDAAIEKLTVRGQDVSWNTVYYYDGTFSLNSNLQFIPDVSAGSSTPISNGEGAYETLASTTTQLTLQSGCSMIIYIDNPDSISVNDVGTTVPVTIYTSQAVYYKEANVQGSSGGTGGGGGQGLEISNAHAWYVSSGSHSEVAMVIQNTNPTEVDFDAILVNSVDASSDAYFAAGSFTVSSPLTYIPSLTDGSQAASQTLQSGMPFVGGSGTLIVYIGSPTGITSEDVGKSITVSFSIMGGGTVDESVVVQSIT